MKNKYTLSELTSLFTYNKTDKELTNNVNATIHDLTIKTFIINNVKYQTSIVVYTVANNLELKTNVYKRNKELHYTHDNLQTEPLFIRRSRIRALPKGVSICKNNKKNPYQAHVYFDKLYHIGNYQTAEDASNAYLTSMEMNTPIRFAGRY